MEMNTPRRMATPARDSGRLYMQSKGTLFCHDATNGRLLRRTELHRVLLEAGGACIEGPLGEDGRQAVAGGDQGRPATHRDRSDRSVTFSTNPVRKTVMQDQSNRKRPVRWPVAFVAAASLIATRAVAQEGPRPPASTRAAVQGPFTPHAVPVALDNITPEPGMLLTRARYTFDLYKGYTPKHVLSLNYSTQPSGNKFPGDTIGRYILSTTLLCRALHEEEPAPSGGKLIVERGDRQCKLPVRRFPGPNKPSHAPLPQAGSYSSRSA